MGVEESLKELAESILGEKNRFFDEETLFRNLIESSYSHETFNGDIEAFFNIDTEKLNVSTELKTLIDNLQKEMSASPYKKNEHLYEISELYMRLEENRGTLVGRTIEDEIKKFYEKHPELYGKENEFPIFNKDGTINEEEKNKLLEYKEKYTRIVILKHLIMVNDPPKELDPQAFEDEKIHILKCSVAALHYENNKDENLRILAEEGKKALKRLFPEEKLETKEELTIFLQKKFGVEKSIEELSKTVYLKLRKDAENDIKRNTRTDLKDDFDISQVFDSKVRMYDEDPIKNYFYESKIDFSDKDVAEFNESYRNYTIDAWIEDKDTAIKLRYVAIQEILNDYKNAQNNPYIQKQIEKLEKEKAKFEEKYKDIDLTGIDVDFEGFKEDFTKAGITKYFTRDAVAWQEGNNYEDLDKDHKKAYIRNILVSLEDIERGKQKGLLSAESKFALRRLELLNSEEREFITFDEYGNYTINEELILEEYRGLSEYRYKSFEELKYSAMLRKNNYILEKLEEYTNLPENAFVNFDGLEAPDEMMEVIEQARRESNQKKFHEIAYNAKIKNDRTLINESPYEKNMHLFEICKLHRELRDNKNIANTQMYNIILSKIKDFHNKHPEYDDVEIPILNEDGTLNDAKVKEMDQFSEAYQRIIIVEQLDKFNGKDRTEIEKMSPKEKQQVLLCSFAGLKYKNSTDKDIRNCVKECERMISLTYPELDLEDGEQLAKFFVEEMGFDANIKKISLDEIINVASLQLKETAEDFIEKSKTFTDKEKIDFSLLDFDSNKRKIYSSVMKNYFVDSKIEFTEHDEKLYNEMYRMFTVDSWIENKENAIKLRYAALNTIKSEYEKKPNGIYTKYKLREIDKDIKEFEEKFGKFDLTEKEGDVPFSLYRQCFVNAGLTKYITRDSSEWSEGINYADLNDEQKKIYIRNTLVALEHENDKDFCMTKLGLRRLELMNSEGNEFLKINPKGEYEINKELLLNEYNKLSTYEYSNYDELKYSAFLRKNEYLLKKLDEYTKIDEKDFVQLKNRSNDRESMEQIEEARYKSNQKLIHGKYKIDEEKEGIRTTTKKQAPRPRIVRESKYFKEKQKVKNVDGKKNDELLQNANDIQVSDTELKQKKDSLEVVQINVSRPENQQDAKKTNETNQVENQVDIDKSQEPVSEQRNDINIENMVTNDNSGFEITEDEKENSNSGLIEGIKRAFNSVKNFISKHIKKKENIGLLVAGNGSLDDTTAATVGMKSTSEKEDFNTLIASGISLQEQQEFAKRQVQGARDGEKDEVEQGERI